MSDETPAAAGGNATPLLDKALKLFNRIESAIAILAFTLMLIDVLAGVVMRYILQVPFSWGEEAARYLMVLGIMAGIGIGVKEGAHLNVELFRSFLPALPRKIIVLLADLITAASFVFLVVVSYKFIALNKSFGQLTAALNIPIYYIYYMLIVGFLIAAVEHIALMYKKFLQGGLDAAPAPEEEKEEFNI